MGIFDDATVWLEARGIDQWHAHPGLRAVVGERIARGETRLCWHGGTPVATLALIWADEETWGPQPHDAGYVHGLAVRRDYAGHAVGRALLDWAAGAVANAGRRVLRLDCIAHNAALRAYYEAAGFTHVGDRSYPGESGASSLFERRVGDG
jgi:ribosomal protein S18 acetylase RimI-like enzyme